MVKYLLEHQKNNIKALLKSSEKRSSGGLAVVIANRCGAYGFHALLWSSILSLITPIILVSSDTDLSIEFIILTQIIVFFALGLLFRINAILMLIVPESIKKQQAEFMANQQFFRQGLCFAKNRSSVLVFISLAERYIKIIADDGINKKLAGNYWKYVISDFTDSMSIGEFEDGLIQVIESCSKTLEQHAPKDKRSERSFNNKLVEIKF